MCLDPVTAMYLSIGMTAYGSYQQYQSQKAFGAYNQRVAENNANLAEQEAQDAEQRGELAEKQRRLEISKLKGQQTSAIASSGFVVGQDSAGDVIADTAALGEQDILSIRNNAQREAWAKRVQATNYRNQGQLAYAEGQAGAQSALITGAGSVADKWYRYKKG